MSQFFERNKRKGLMALLFFFRNRKNDAVPLVLLAVAGASGLMLLPSVQSHVSWPLPIARALHVAVHMGSPDFPDMGRAIFAAKARQDASSRIFLLGYAAGSYPGQSSLALVAGAADLLKAPRPTAERLGGKTIQGLASPANPRGVPTAVALTAEEMKSGLANADPTALIAGTATSAGAGPENRILLAEAGGYSGARAVDAGPGGLVQRMMDTRERSLAGGRNLIGAGGQLSRLSAFSQQKGVQVVNAWNSGQGPRCDQAADALCDLVVARTYSKGGKKYMDQCPSCPKEPGAHMASISFDGHSLLQSGVVTASDEATPIDNGSYVDSLMTSGEDLANKINGCDDVAAALSQSAGSAGMMASLGEQVSMRSRQLKSDEDLADASRVDCHNGHPLSCGQAAYYTLQAYFEMRLPLPGLQSIQDEYLADCQAYQLREAQGICAFRDNPSFVCESPEEQNFVQKILDWR